jgi:uncharacterized membrane-anchored protein YitT (DUF2179 family)
MKRSKTFLNKSYDVLMILIGGLLEAIGINSFLIPSGFFEGGATGLSMLGSTLTATPLYLLLVIINTPFLMMGWKRFGYKYIIKCIVAIIYLSLLIKFLHLGVFSHDKILCAVFGGILVGAGTGFAINGGSALDGIEIASIILGNRLGLTVGSMILSFNVIIFSVIALFLGYEPALYSVLTYIFSSKTTNFLVHGLEEFVGVSVISKNINKIRKVLIDEMGIGVTIYNGRTGLKDVEQDILFCVVTKYDIHRIRTMINTIDDKAFLIMNPVDSVQGGLVKTKLRNKRV